MPIAVETIRQGATGEETESKQQQLVKNDISGNVAGLFGLDSAMMMEGAMMMDGTMILMDGMTGGEYAPMLLDEYTCNGDECADLSFFGLPSPTAQPIPAETMEEKSTPTEHANSANSNEASGDAKPVRAMTEEEMSSLLTFFQEAPERATHNLRNKRVGDLRGASAKHILKTTGQSIHCVIWEGKHYISSYDIIKVLKVLVIDDGQGNMYDGEIDIESKKFEENVFSVLRQLKVGVNCQLEEARSDFLDWLVRHDCIRTQKKQKVFYWHDVNVTVMAKEIRNRCLRNGIPTKSILTGPRSADTANSATATTGQHQTYPAGAKLPIQPQHKKPRLDAGYPSIQPQYMMPYGMPAPQRIQQMAQAYQAYQLQLQQHIQMQQQQTMQPQMHQPQEQYYQQQQQQQYMPMQQMPQEFNTQPYQDMLVSPGQIPEDLYLNYLNISQSPVQTTVTQPASSPSFSMQSQLNEDSSPVLSYVDPGALDMNNYPFAATGQQSYYDESAYYYSPASNRAISPINERKHMCNICGRGFKRNEHLKRHEFTHTGEKRHSCKYCNKLFARSDNLQQHLKQTHKKEWEDEEEQRRRTPRGGISPSTHLGNMQHMSQMGLFDQRPSALVQEQPISNADDLDAMLNFHFANSLVDLDKLNL